MKQQVAIFWFRRDLRLQDNTGLFHALQSGYPVLPIFIFDSEILEKLPKGDARVPFIHATIQNIKNQLVTDHQRDLGIYSGTPQHVFEILAQTYDIAAVYTNHDYEPYAIARDQKIKELLQSQGIAFHSYKDQVIFERDDIVKADGTPYVVYTPYKNKWKTQFTGTLIESFPSEQQLSSILQDTTLPTVTLDEIGFQLVPITASLYDVSPTLIDQYEDTRNYPAQDQGTSKLGPHLRFGTVSIRDMVRKAIAETNEIFWSELIWREFFMQILWHFPHTKEQAFRPKYDRIEWRNNEDEFEAWKQGKTGYPFVDAGMRQLNQTGYMHNRVRMIVASFLCKHLLIDWRWGEAYFAEKLLDYDMAANVGNWQWASGSGVDAAPYFRIFNPTTQITKFDKKLSYINTWVQDLNELTYPTPIVDHKIARERCLTTYKNALQ